MLSYKNVQQIQNLCIEYMGAKQNESVKKNLGMIAKKVHNSLNSLLNFVLSFCLQVCSMSSHKHKRHIKMNSLFVS